MKKQMQFTIDDFEHALRNSLPGAFSAQFHRALPVSGVCAVSRAGRHVLTVSYSKAAHSRSATLLIYTPGSTPASRSTFRHHREVSYDALPKFFEYLTHLLRLESI